MLAGVDALMHLSCTGMTVDEIKQVLVAAREAGIQNILALRGDPQKGIISWEPTRGGFLHAIDLVRLIRQEHGDHFCIAVAGFPEGHPQSKSNYDMDIMYLRDKVNAGADFILTQFFYDTAVFIDFVKRCRENDILCPIIPGMMPIQNYSSFQRMTSFCKTRVPDQILDDLAPVKEDDEAVKDYGKLLPMFTSRSLISIFIDNFTLLSRN